MAAAPDHPSLTAPFAARAEHAQHPLTAYLLRLMDLKASNLCVSADVSSARELLTLADKLGPSIVVFKTHHDIISGWDFNPQTGTGARLAALARKHGFLIFEDRKIGDIGNTAQLQYTSGSARIIEWAHIVNVNMIPGAPVVKALAEAAARWRERYPYEVKTSVSVGTPKADSFDEDDEDGGSSKSSNNGNNNISNTNINGTAPATAGDPSADGSPSRRRSSGGMQGLRGHADGRKSSIVSITTVTQSYEPAASPRTGKNLGDGLGDELFPGIEEAPMERGLLILAQMSSAGNLMDARYTDACVQAAREHRGFVMGFVSQQGLNAQPDDAFIHMTPGCQLPPADADEQGNGNGNGAPMGDGKGQQYNTPQRLIEGAGVDVVIVGRGIIKAGNPQSEAERYRREAWRAYLSRIHRQA